MTIDEAKLELDKSSDKDEEYHAIYDRVMLDRLKELDPEFYKAVDDYYNDNMEARWYA